MQGCRTRFPLLSLLCAVTFSFIMLHNTVNVTSNTLLNDKCITSIKGAAFVKHNYMSFAIQNMFACYYRCKEDIRCQSLNFYEKTHLCELNNRTRILRHLNFLSQEGAFYLDNPFRGKWSILRFPFFLHFSYHFVNNNYLVKIIKN